MPRAKTDPWYVRQVGPLVEEGLGAPRITQRLEERAKESERDDWPSARTVDRLVREYKELPEWVRREQAAFSWPRAMQTGALPWEASQASLELLRLFDERGLGRPTIRLAKWFWRLRQAAPDLPAGEGTLVAAHLALAEYSEVAKVPYQVKVEGLEWALAYRKWASEENETAYSKAAERHGAAVTRTTGLGLDGWKTFLEVLDGVAVASTKDELPDVWRPSEQAQEDKTDG